MVGYVVLGVIGCDTHTHPDANKTFYKLRAVPISFTHPVLQTVLGVGMGMNASAQVWLALHARSHTGCLRSSLSPSQDPLAPRRSRPRLPRCRPPPPRGRVGGRPDCSLERAKTIPDQSPQALSLSLDRTPRKTGGAEADDRREALHGRVQDAAGAAGKGCLRGDHLFNTTCLKHVNNVANCGE